MEAHCAGRRQLERFVFTTLYGSLVFYESGFLLMTLMPRIFAFSVFGQGFWHKRRR